MKKTDKIDEHDGKDKKRQKTTKNDKNPQKRHEQMGCQNGWPEIVHRDLGFSLVLFWHAVLEVVPPTCHYGGIPRGAHVLAVQSPQLQPKPEVKNSKTLKP